MASSLISATGKNSGVIFDRNFNELKSLIATVETAITRFKEAEARLGAVCSDEDLARILVAQLDLDWWQANASGWPKSFWGKRRVRKLLPSYAKSGITDPDRDLPLLRTMKMSADEVASSPLRVHSPGWQGIAVHAFTELG